MKVSELISKLMEIRETKGDLTVTCWPYEGIPEFPDYHGARVEILLKRGRVSRPIVKIGQSTEFHPSVDGR